MLLRFMSLLFLVILNGRASFQELDFSKPLIPIPERQEAKPKEQKVWVEAKTGRIWVNPRVDENGDLVEGHYKNVVLEPGHWAVNGNEHG